MPQTMKYLPNTTGIGMGIGMGIGTGIGVNWGEGWDLGQLLSIMVRGSYKECIKHGDWELH